MRWLAAVGRGLALLGQTLEWLGRGVVWATLVGLLVVVSLQLVDRHFIEVPIAAPDAYARILVIWLTFVGFALAVRSGLAIRVDLMDHWLPTGVRRALEILFDVVKLAVIVLLIVKGWLLVDIGFDQAILGTDLTTAVPNAGLWLGSLMMFVFVLTAMLRIMVSPGAEPHEDDKTGLRAE